LATPLLGNRVDRFVWDGENLTFDLNLIMLRSFQNDAAPEPPDQGDEEQPPRGNHDGGVMVFGQDGTLHIFIGDVGRRGQMQNLPCGPVEECDGETEPDDQFGGPEPDDAHLTGVILRLNPDGTAPEDNPFFEAGAAIGGEVGENIQKVFSYGHRNSFGMAIDPITGNLWLSENGDDSFSEINRIVPGLNGGWIQIMGPAERIEQFKEIETTFSANPAAPPALQQLRWPPTNIADSPDEALERLFMLPGATYQDPVFSWKWEVSPAGIGFLNSRALGERFEGDLFVGAAIPQLEGGYLFRFNLDDDREGFEFRRSDLRDGVADNLAKHEITESRPLLIGRNFGAITDIEMGPNGNLYVVSLTQGTVYEIFKVGDDTGDVEFSTELTGEAEVPGPGDPDGSGMATITINTSKRQVCFALMVDDIEPATAAHIHVGPPDVAGPVVIPLNPPPTGGASTGCANNVDRALLRNILQRPERYYVNVHNEEFPAGAVRGQLPGEDDDGNGNGSEFSATMTGAAEVPGPGDPDGMGAASVRVNPDQNQICFGLAVSGIEPATAAHIHVGAPDEAGPVVVPLTPPDANGSSNGCVSDVDTALIQNILQNPEQYYVNVHNAEFPDGAVRGQLTR
ncbi:MAG TPA: CHRD domain-containing protein, partial [Anaerolineales bacterium]|nr:CHRD domain-containing protein [Anaerolineales bacterium]